MHDGNGGLRVGATRNALVVEVPRNQRIVQFAVPEFQQRRRSVRLCKRGARYVPLVALSFQRVHFVNVTGNSAMTQRRQMKSEVRWWRQTDKDSIVSVFEQTINFNSQILIAGQIKILINKLPSAKDSPQQSSRSKSKSTQVSSWQRSWIA